ncbi:MAG: class I SAM-dependent methyltransferase [Thermoplasmatota archaeon]
MWSPCLAVPRRRAERLRQWLLDQRLLRTDLAIRRDEQFVYLPVRRDVDVEETRLLEMEFEEREREPRWQEALVGVLPDGASLSSFDVVGDIAILRLPPDMDSYRREVGRAILSAQKNIRVVCNDRGVKDHYRVRDLEVIAGEQRTETTHREHGISMTLDVSQVYFSPRLATERRRVADQVQPGETVIDMFAGVAPFSLVIAAVSRPSQVYAIDVNPVAVRYARLNVQRNRLQEHVTVVQGDARQVLPSLPPADHIVMNLPHSAQDFFSLAVDRAGVIHYYDILEPEKIGERLDWLRSRAEEKGRQATVRETRTVGMYSPRQVKLGVDVVID